MTGMDETKMIRSSLFSRQPRDSYDRRVISDCEQKHAACLQTTPEFGIDGGDEIPAEVIRKALSVIAEAQIPFRLNYSSFINMRETSLTHASNAQSVSTASTSFTRNEVGKLNFDEVSDLETDEENEVPATRTPPDALFIAQGKEFPCHTRILSKDAPPLLDILTRDGVLERKTKKQRISPSSRCQPEGEERMQAWSSPSGITVARLPKDVNSDYFEVLMEFLYTNEIRIKLPGEDHEIDEEEDPWLADKEDLNDSDDDCEDIGYSLDCLLYEQNEDAKPTMTPLKFLQESFIQADRFGCTSLKDAIENKLYDEFLFSFTAKELFRWADQNNCAFLKEKAKDKLSASSFQDIERQRKPPIPQDSKIV